MEMIPQVVVREKELKHHPYSDCMAVERSFSDLKKRHEVRWSQRWSAHKLNVIHIWCPRREKNLRKGPWLEEEDEQLNAIVTCLGERRWDALAKASGLRRSGKSCRLRWMNYLRPNLKHGLISEEEEQIILQLHEQWGNKWSKIAQRLPGRTDNELKNYWRSHLRKKAQGIAFDAKQDLLTSNCDTVITARTSNGDCTSVKEDDIRATSVDSSDALELPNFALADSLYEARVSDWMSCWANDQSRMKHHDGNCYSLDSCFCYLALTSETSVWDYSSSIWDII